MKIEVKCSCSDGNCPEWAIVEIQGMIEVQPCFKDRIQNLEIGILCRTSSEENYTFTVGYHELSGTKMKLKKPYLILKKKRTILESIPDDEEEEEDISKANSPKTETELEVIGIIRHRILFKTRPKPLISKPQVVVKEKKSGPTTTVPMVQ
ncbi:chromosome transmission fidelity protein 8 homolog [Papaver somniferum]|uniref:chromosome transmission fidelity protein 8 homolog n=1 Tax=Papaver somniferum TaxID=3469 RepID=UPI000E6F935C|nr:chromosome transmission fidelity protein 8 homolog [Papaver somniferum]